MWCFIKQAYDIRGGAVRKEFTIEMKNGLMKQPRVPSTTIWEAAIASQGPQEVAWGFKQGCLNLGACSLRWLLWNATNSFPSKEEGRPAGYCLLRGEQITPKGKRELATQIRRRTKIWFWILKLLLLFTTYLALVHISWYLSSLICLVLKKRFKING